jgi:hypothetical protein
MISDYFAFAKIRNLFDWAISLYFYRKQQVDQAKPDWMTSEPNEFNKRDFLAFLNSGEQPQHFFLGKPEHSVKILIHDRLENDFRKVCEILELGNLDLPRINASTRPLGFKLLD